MPTTLASRLQGLNLYLVGMMGAGKSAVGRPLASALGYRFLDADQAIVQVAGRSIPDLFASDGEAGFRQLETEVLTGIANWHSLVVATGGGVVLKPENWGVMRQGVVIWLDAPDPLILQRLQADPTPRPLMQGPDPAARLRELLNHRRPLYAQADLHISQAGESPEQVAALVLEGLPALIKETPQAPLTPARLVDGEGRATTTFN